jgi:hypothetical protein
VSIETQDINTRSTTKKALAWANEENSIQLHKLCICDCLASENLPRNKRPQYERSPDLSEPRLRESRSYLNLNCPTKVEATPPCLRNLVFEAHDSFVPCQYTSIAVVMGSQKQESDQEEFFSPQQYSLRYSRQMGS